MTRNKYNIYSKSSLSVEKIAKKIILQQRGREDEIRQRIDKIYAFA